MKLFSRSLPSALRSLMLLCMALWASTALAAPHQFGWGLSGEGQTVFPADLRGITAVEGGIVHTVALKTDGTVVAWGWNDRGQTAVPPGLSGVKAIAVGGFHSLALKGDGTVVAWGYNVYGQSTVPDGLSGVKAISAGTYHSLALKSDGTVVAWGNNGDGQGNIPAGLSNVKAIGAGGAHSLALKADGTVVAWGDNSAGQINLPAGLAGVKAIAAGGGHNLALKANGAVVAWGYNFQSQSTVPAGLSGVIAVAAGEYHSLALKADGAVVAWGDNQFGQATIPAGLSGIRSISTGDYTSFALKGIGAVSAWGNNEYGQSNAPDDLIGVKGVAAGATHSLALKRDGTVSAWGFGEVGQADVPPGLKGVAEVRAGSYHSLALKADGTVAAWGWSGGGQSTIPAGLTDVVAVEAGGVHSLALKADGTVVAWGDDTYEGIPMPAGLTNVVAISARESHSLALKADGTVVAWGNNSFLESSVPGDATGMIGIAAGAAHSLALRANGTLRSWGSNSDGQLDVGGLSGVVAASGGNVHSVFVEADGDVVVRGSNALGQKNIPFGLHRALAVTAGGNHSLAIFEDLVDPSSSLVSHRGTFNTSTYAFRAAGPYASDTWTNQDIRFMVSAEDLSPSAGLGGIRLSATGAASLPNDLYETDSSFINRTEGVTTLTYHAEDLTGNTEAAKTLVMKIDRTLPGIAFNVPAQGATYRVGEDVRVFYGCDDALSGIQSSGGCVGTVPYKDYLNTSTPGTKSFTVTARDNAGNSRTQTITYTVQHVNDAQFVSQVAPLNAATAGVSYPVSVTVRNTGTTTWTRSGGYVLSSQNPLSNTNWGTNLVYLPAGVSVGPKQSYTFTFTAKAPSTLGTYNYQWRMAQSGVGWFGEFTPNQAIKVVAHNAQFISHNPPPATMAKGQTALVSVTMKNAGTTTWSGNTFVLTSQNPQSNTNWGTNLRYLPAGVSVAPGQSYTFNFTATAPNTAGTYNFQWRMAKSGDAWFGDFSTNTVVTVN